LAYLIGDKGKKKMNSILGVSKFFETFCVVMGHSRRPINPKRKRKMKWLTLDARPNVYGGAP
jgi:hypothetical protein